MNNLMFSFIFMLISIFFVLGCTKKGVYEGFRSDQRIECIKYESNAEYQECLERTGMNYDEYERLREDAISQ